MLVRQSRVDVHCFLPPGTTSTYSVNFPSQDQRETVTMLGIIGELPFIGGIILNVWAFSPPPWHSNDVTNSMLYFTPYNEPVGYVAPNPCASSPLSNAEVPITYGAPMNTVNYYSNVAVWMGPLGMFNLLCFSFSREGCCLLGF
jgi:hypothetical protein